MRRQTIYLWIGYVWATTLAGLAIHPYQSARRMVFKDKVLLPVAFSPLLGLLIFFFIGRVGSYVMNLHGLQREIMALVLGSTLIGLLMWQVLIAALLYRFWRAQNK